MKKEERTKQLSKTIEILRATFTYILDCISKEDLPAEDIQNIKQYYQQKQTKSEAYFKERQLYKLQLYLEKYLEFPRRRCDIGFNTYIENITSYKIDIFERYHKRIDEIIEQQNINTKKELHEVAFLHHLYNKHFDKTKAKSLEKILSSYYGIK